VAAAEFRGNPRKGFGVQGQRPGFFFVNLVEDREKPFQVPFMLGPEKGFYEFIEHILLYRAFTALTIR
jgi:hypothetical protein